MAQDAYNKRPIQNIRQNDLVMSAADMVERYMFGVDLTDDNGTGYLKKNIEFQILSAQEWLEKQIPGLLLHETEVTSEVHDYYLQDYVAFSFIKLYRFPVQSVSELSIQFPLATNIVTFDPSWYRIESVGAQVQLVPTQGTFSTILLSQGGSFLPLLYQGQQNVPALFRVTYKAGFKKNEIPFDIMDIIGLKASIMPMNIAGDLIAGAGIASKNISLDGASQGIVTTASAENTGYSANIKQREKEIESKLKDLRRYYSGFSLVVA